MDPQPDLIDQDGEKVVRLEHVLPMRYAPTKGSGKEPTPDEEWLHRRQWRPRKRPPTRELRSENLKAVLAVTRKLCVPQDALDELPRRPDGSPANSPELRAALQAYTVAGGTLQSFCVAVGLPRSTLYKWIRGDREWSEDYEDAKKLGADALVEEALEIAETPQPLEDVYLSYDGNGNLLRKDVRRSDAIYARKLAVTTKLEVAKKWAPEKYGDKIEVKTDDGLAARILAARKRTTRAEPVEDLESEDAGD